MNTESLLIHGGIEGDERTGAVNQTSTYKQSEFGKDVENALIIAIKKVGE